MKTIKLPYNCSDESRMLIKQYQCQYSSCLHFLYNRIFDNPDISEPALRKSLEIVQNISLLDSWFQQSAVKEAKAIYAARKTLEFSLTEKQKRMLNEDQIAKKERQFEHSKFRVIWGGRKNFIRRCKQLITHDEWQELKLSPVYSIGAGNAYGNRKFRLSDEQTVVFKPNRQTTIRLELLCSSNNYLYELRLLYLAQCSKQLAISYKLDQSFIYISFDEEILYKNKFQYTEIPNRVMSIDMNPNYIGWTIVDWKDENDFKIIKSGVYKLKDITDSDKGSTYVSHKLKHESCEIAKNLINKALYYKCSLFSLEDLNIKTKDLNKGKDYNRLCNNQWLRNTLVNNLSKRCHIFGIRILKVAAQYSSSNGNLLFRHLGLPDMCLAAFEIGRRTYEFNAQYIDKTKQPKKNIIQPDLSLFQSFYVKSLEEFDIETEINLIDLYYLLKKSSRRYRIPVDRWSAQFFRFSSHKSKVSQLLLN